MSLLYSTVFYLYLQQVIVIVSIPTVRHTKDNARIYLQIMPLSRDLSRPLNDEGGYKSFKKVMVKKAGSRINDQ